MTKEELEAKLTSIYHEFGDTIQESETDKQVIERSKKWFVERLSKETDDEAAIESIALLANMEKTIFLYNFCSF